MQAAGITRLFLVGDFELLDDPEIEDRGCPEVCVNGH
jgi:hypothetical protein